VVDQLVRPRTNAASEAGARSDALSIQRTQHCFQTILTSTIYRHAHGWKNPDTTQISPQMSTQISITAKPHFFSQREKPEHR
jgi:hypothetical protein